MWRAESRLTKLTQCPNLIDLGCKWKRENGHFQLMMKLDIIYQKLHNLSCQKCGKSFAIVNLYAKNVVNQAIFVDGLWPQFYACGRFMKYSMSLNKIIQS